MPRKMIVSDSKDWKIETQKKKRLRLGMAMMWQAIANEAKQLMEKGSNLPTNWRNRLLKKAA